MKARFFSKAKLARKISSHHFIIGKYERDEMTPSVEVAKKMAELLETTVGYLLGEVNETDTFKDPVMFKRMAEIENLPQRDKECLLLTVDNFIKATKLNML